MQLSREKLIERQQINASVIWTKYEVNIDFHFIELIRWHFINIFTSVRSFWRYKTWKFSEYLESCHNRKCYFLKWKYFNKWDVKDPHFFLHYINCNIAWKLISRLDRLLGRRSALNYRTAVIFNMQLQLVLYLTCFYSNAVHFVREGTNMPLFLAV